VKEELTSAQLAFVEAHRGEDTFPEMEIRSDHRRVYPREGLAAHVIGYTGEITEGELNTTEFGRFQQGDIIGKVGIERHYNDLLMGEDGQRRVVVDNRGKERRVIQQKEPIAGTTIKLTIDLDLQVVAELAMRGRRGAVAALDPRNGEVLAMVSSPAYDPNKFVGRIRRSDWQEIIDNPDHPLLNRAIQSQLSPGSTFKPIVALAGLETNTIDDHSAVTCTGGTHHYNRYVKCHTTHGTISLRRAIMQSCDVYFYNLGDKLGIDKIAQYAGMAGLGQRTGIDLPHEYEGIVPSHRWKIRTYRQRWFAGETINVAIGQGYLTVTPLQLAHAIGGLALGGVWQRPHLLKDPPPPVEAPRKAAINPENVNRIVSGMFAVVNEPGGTADRSALPGITLCGKTGTAQIASNEFVKARRGRADAGELADNAWFVGFAPRTNPEIVVAVLYEGGLHGDRAAPIARDIVRAYFEKKGRKTRETVVVSANRSEAN
jgi:penicillin-binding protein 2